MTNTTAVVFSTSTVEGAVVHNSDLLVECGWQTVCDARGHHDLVNTVGPWLECVDCWYTDKEDWGCCEDCG